MMFLIVPKPRSSKVAAVFRRAAGHSDGMNKHMINTKTGILPAIY
ncbi:hypothetical protein [Aquitalea denitrificans]|nr:hypothetical protein [Aquitalea denitrificans]